MKTYHIETTKDKGYCRAADDVLVYRGSRYGVGMIPEGQEDRQVQHGPMVPGPWAFVYGLCLVFDNQGGTGEEMKRLRSKGLVHDVERGDVVVVDGTRHNVMVKNGQIELAK